MFEARSHLEVGGTFDTFSVVDAINDFLDASGLGKKHMLRARVSSDSRLGTHPDIAILNDDKAPNEEEKAKIISALQASLSQKFGVEVKPDDKPEFLRTVKGRIPTRGSQHLQG
ncbi:MAG: hypothetical protein AAF244_02465 [Pseudomonadota bacterium]